jgi:hypothetical protein
LKSTKVKALIKTRQESQEHVLLLKNDYDKKDTHKTSFDLKKDSNGLKLHTRL